ncbi:uncharacterized protein LOC112524969 [Cynara cardunculus var. scolymus]|uniref:uncharacterized protein LOC112524969 n=1 Tax=Cynara cardunculus var. scolymus TaxID=59895 RepID=UPI000D629D5F|nr:uncharacterized protein LOC112524969 [Cynara cardunculus var. scolymus]
MSEYGTRIILDWDARVLDVMVLEAHSQYLNCKVLVRGSQHYIFVSFVYGANVCNARRALWSGLGKFKVLIGSSPWVVMRDFNTMLFPHDGFRGSSRRNLDMADFYAFVEDVEIFDLHYTGVHFTWNQKPNSSGGIMRKLDRAMGNDEFTSVFQDVNVHFHPSGLSDHPPVMITFKCGIRKKRCGFKFDNFLTEHPSFLQVVKNEWANNIEGSFMFRVTSHLKALKTPLRKLRHSYGNLGQRVAFLKTELDRIQLDVDNDPSNVELGQELGHIRIAYQNACRDENCAAKQRAKIAWLNEGDLNTKFFHKVIKERHHYNSIQSVCTSDGAYVYGDDVPNVFVDHFKDFLGTRYVSPDPTTNDDVFMRKLSLVEANHMIRPIHNEEIRNAIFSIGNYKAPGSDGYSSKFFKEAWNIVGRDLLMLLRLRITGL